jgi:hypothetical protein
MRSVLLALVACAMVAQAVLMMRGEKLAAPGFLLLSVFSIAGIDAIIRPESND